jgi:cation:H+ antiporter
MDLSSLSLPWLAAIFLAAAVIVWFAGARLARYADEIANRTGIGRAVVGVILLGAVTSLPEISTTSVASLTGNSDMAVNNLIGSASFQLVVLAICDLLVGRGALTSMVPGPRVILNALVSMVLLVLVVIGAMVGDWPAVGHVGLFPLLLAGTYVLCIWQLSRAVAAAGWEPTGGQELERPPPERPGHSNWKLVWLTAISAAAILASGTILTLSAEAIAESSGSSTGIIGLTLLAAATSLPEFSTAIAAVKLGRAELAIGDILGGNMFNTVLILQCDALDGGGLVLGEVQRSSMAAALIAVLLTSFYLIGLVERRDKVVFRMGYDSIAVLVAYAAGMAAILGGAIPA